MSRSPHKQQRAKMARASLVFTAAVVAFAITSAGNSPVFSFDQEPGKLNRFVQSSGGSDAATKVFREARDLINDEQWARAEHSFSDFISSYPKDKNVDAALYWIAFALKKQNKLREADGVLERLIRDFPASSWVDDARTLRIEIAPKLKNTDAIEKGIIENDEEIKLAALQSLFEANPERALKVAAEILKPGSGSSSLMKEGAITLLADSRGAQAISILAAIARSEADFKIRRKAILALGELEGDDSTFDELMKLFESDKDETIRMEIISALSEIESPRARAKLLEIARASNSIELRKRAISAIAEQEDEKSVEGLIQLFDSERDEDVKEEILSALGESNQKRALRKLMEIVKSNASARLRKRALSLLGESDDPEAAKFLEQIIK